MNNPDSPADPLLEREKQLRTWAAQWKHAEREERSRLSRVLHDQVQQLLVAAKIQAEIVAAAVDASHVERLNKVVSLLTDALNATRDLAVQLTPPLLHDQGLPAALEWLIARAAKQYDLHVDSQIDPAANPADEETRDVLFQTAQEFLLNAVKHAGVRQATLRLSRENSVIRLQVGDRGPGFPSPEATDGRGSFGLFQLRQRLEAIGGSLRLESAPAQGALATAEVPAAR